jgi:putative ABC transport system permease protein
VNDFTIIRRSLTSRGFSTAVTIALVAVAVGLMVLLLSLRRSGQRAFERGAGDMHMLVSRDASPLVSVLNGIFHASPPRNPITWAKYREIAEGFPLDYAVPVQQGDSFRGHPVVATDPTFFSRYRPDPDLDWSFAQGRAFVASFEVVLGADVAAATGLAPSDTLHLAHGAGAGVPHHDHGDHVHQDFPYTVVGILEPTGGPHDRALFTDLESSWILHAHDRRQLEANDPHVTTRREDLTEADRLITGIYLRVFTRPGSQVSAAQQQVFDMLRKDLTITVASPAQQVASLFTIVSNIDDLFLAMAAVVMVSSAIAIAAATDRGAARARVQPGPGVRPDRDGVGDPRHRRRGGRRRGRRRGRPRRRRGHAGTAGPRDRAAPRRRDRLGRHARRDRPRDRRGHRPRPGGLPDPGREEPAPAWLRERIAEDCEAFSQGDRSGIDRSGIGGSAVPARTRVASGVPLCAGRETRTRMIPRCGGGNPRPTAQPPATSGLASSRNPTRAHFLVHHRTLRSPDRRRVPVEPPHRAGAVPGGDDDPRPAIDADSAAVSDPRARA